MSYTQTTFVQWPPEGIPRERCDGAPLNPSADGDRHWRSGDAPRTAGARLPADEMDGCRPRRSRLPLAARAPGLGAARARPPHALPLDAAYRLPPASVRGARRRSLRTQLFLD